MTVKELIEVLSKVDQEKKVYFVYEENMEDYHQVKTIKEDIYSQDVDYEKEVLVVLQ